jgi:hypothetical protein
MTEARENAECARTQLNNARAQNDEVTARAQHLDKVMETNNLGPKFWEAVAARRSRDA